MRSLISFRNVSLYEKEDFGISRINFELKKGKKYSFYTNTQEQANTVLGLLENRYRYDSGIVIRHEKLFIQSDRLLLGDKAYSKQVNQWLALKSEFFMSGGKPRSKQGFIETLNARHILHFPIFKLKGEDKIKFTLLSLAFQERGMLIISKLPVLPLTDIQRTFLKRLISESHTTVCLFASGEKKGDDLLSTHPDRERIDIT